MNYIYDILLNFNRQLYDFFEWNLNDNIVHIRKIPLYRVDSKTLLDIRDYKIRVSDDFLERIRHRTEVFTSKDVDTIEYATLFTDGSNVFALKFNRDGESVKKSMLLVDEEVDVLDVSNRLQESCLEYKMLGNEVYHPLKTRREQKMEKFVLDELYKSKKEKANEKLKYLYFECFGKVEDSVEEIFSQFRNRLQSGDYCMVHKLYDFFKLTFVHK